MQPEGDDTRAVEEVVGRLAERHDHLPRHEVEQLVRDGFSRWAGAPVQSFVPVMVERWADDLLRNRSAP